jgi:hypothetical protein
MDKIHQVQSVWCDLTGQIIKPRALERMFYEFVAIGFTSDDLRCVVQHMQRANKRMKGAAFTFRVHRVVGDLEWFASMLAESRAKERNLKPGHTPKQQALQKLRPVVEEPLLPANCIHIKEALRRAIR